MIPLVGKIRSKISWKDIVIAFLAIIISCSAGYGVYSYLKKDVTIVLDGKKMEVKTMKATVQDVLEQNGIEIGSEDYISVPLDSELQKKKNEIIIKKAVSVKVVVGEEKKPLMTYHQTVGEALENSPYKLSGKDRLEGVSASDKVVKDMKIPIVTVREEMVTEKETIPFEVVKRENNYIDKGVERVIRDGKEGIKEKIYKVVLENGKETIKQLIKDSVVAEPVNKVVEYGTVLNFKTSRGESVRYKKVLDMRATSYTASYADTGKNPGDPGFGITYTGMKVRKGIVAVDPKVIPLGTRLYVEIPGSTPDYGFAIAADIGSAVKGDIIDLYLDSREAVKNWGVRKAKVYILTN